MKGEPNLQRLILDTNVWLDWFVFAQADDAPIMQLQRMIATQTPPCEIVMTRAMWDEWVDVLGRAQFAVSPERQAQILAATRDYVRMIDTPPTPRARIRCVDVDDQIFIDAALSLPVDWLLSKDRHLLKLRTRARQRGVHIATVEQWWLAQCAVEQDARTGDGKDSRKPD